MDHFCDLAKNVATFSCPKNSPEANQKSNRLISLAEKISKQPNSDFVIWLLIITLIQVYNEKEYMEQKVTENILKEKIVPRKLMLEPRLYRIR